MAPAVTITSVDASPDVYEQDNVHSVYDEIASHFSQTRYKPWPIIAAFLQSMHPTWIGLDSGTGNGKYLPLCCPWTIGLDRSRNLLEIARTAGGAAREVVQGDVLDNSWRTGVFDYTVRALYQESIDLLAADFHCDNPPSSDSRAEKTRYSATLERSLPAPRTRPYLCLGDAARRAIETQRPNNGRKQRPRCIRPVDGELDALAVSAAQEMGLHVGAGASEGVEIVQQGWERSNHFVELRRYKR
uniref:Methyltransferase domain-containing protein n=1 Tax=Mycena chlorophos TaxID=658473 RepID=A0ABQ0KYW9_MYCCL|nr:predicted protein [Mycena chlorophos]